MIKICCFVLLVIRFITAVAQESPTSAPTFGPTFSPSGAPTLDDVTQCHEQDQFVFVRSEQVNFTNARQRCKDREGNLARIQNTIEFELVGSMTSGFVAWIGVDALQAREENNGARNPGTVDFVFTDGVTEGVEFCQGEINQQPWRFDQPDNNQNREDCVTYVTDRTWNDAPCFFEHFYVCRFVEAADCKTDAPSPQPTKPPTPDPTTKSPTKNPTKSPTKKPTKSPTENPTKSPTKKPTKSPTTSPTEDPTTFPTKKPTKLPTKNPTKSPTEHPTKSPTKKPTKSPTTSPTEDPTTFPTKNPTKSPTKKPTKSPTENPTTSPTEGPTKSPTDTPTPSPTKNPTFSPAIPVAECENRELGVTRPNILFKP